jgi:hypothetical protein
MRIAMVSYLTSFKDELVVEKQFERRCDFHLLPSLHIPHAKDTNTGERGGDDQCGKCPRHWWHLKVPFFQREPRRLSVILAMWRSVVVIHLCFEE